MSREPIHHPVLLTAGITFASVVLSLLVTEFAMQAAGVAFLPVAYYLAGGIPAVAVPLTVYPLLTIINRQRLLRLELEHVANTDSLTGLPNRRAFFSGAARILAAPARPEAPVTAMMIDVDHFKAINDAGGHVAGDGVLVETAKQIRDVIAAAEPGDWILARIGGDEFAALISGLVPSAIARLADRLCRTVRPVGDASGALVPTLSIGVASRSGEMDIDRLIKLADDAAYAAKRAGRDRWAFASNTDPALQPVTPRVRASSAVQ